MQLPGEAIIMTERVLGARGGKRRRRLILALPVAVLAALLLALSGSAGNSNLTNFEIDGDLFSGVFNVTPTATGLDWVAGTTGSGVLVCPAPCTPGVVADNPAVPGTATFFRDPLKVDPDPTTFTQGDKENDFANVTDPPPVGGTLQSETPWHIVSGSVPPQKDDLFDVVTYTRIIGGDAELDLGMLRTNNNGSSHLDFELNRVASVACAANSSTLCPIRTEGDLLVSFEISPGSITQRFFVWDLPGGTDGGGKGRGGVECVGPLSGQEKPCPWEEISPPANSGGLPTVITAVNTTDVPAGPWGSRLPNGDATTTIPAGGWFEASLDLDGLGFAPSCPGFGQASAKSRSSDSIPSALMDLAGPFPIDLNTCGKLTIIKNTVPNALQDFHYTTAVTTPGAALSPVTFDLDDDAGVAGGNDTLLDTRVYNQVTPGGYTVTEDAVTGYATTINCTATSGSSGAQDGVNPRKANITLANLGEVTCTFTNTLQQGAIKIIKTGKDKRCTGAGTPDANCAAVGVRNLSGAQFEIKKGGVLVPGGTVTTTNGVVCKDGLDFGNDYTVQETAAPTGYQRDNTAAVAVIVDTAVTCSGTVPASQTKTFTDTPLTTITVSTTSLAGVGVTESTVQCTGELTASATPHTTGSYVPGTVTCTIIIDP